MSNRYEAEKERVLKELRKRLDELFPPDKLRWPTCPFCKVPMYEVTQKGTNTYYQCFETPNGKPCLHKDFDV